MIENHNLKHLEISLHRNDGNSLYTTLGIFSRMNIPKVVINTSKLRCMLRERNLSSMTMC